jgi:hypothetical protein
MKLIDADKVLEWCKKRFEMEMPDARYSDGRRTILELMVGEIQLGNFDPTPPVQPDIKVGDKVRHKQYKSYGEGVVGEISGSGKSAWVRPWSAYYRLDKLEVITDDQR